jgi:hypothetical protein
MATLFTFEAIKGRGAPVSGETAIRFQGDAGWGVMSEARRERLDKKSKRARDAALPPVLR